MTRLLAAALTLVGCTQSPEDVVGPFTGQPRRFIVDSIMLPVTSAQARDLGGDLDGDGAVENQLGMAIRTLASQGNITTHGLDMIGGGAIASSLEIVSDDPLDDATVSVRYLGADVSPSTIAGGTLIDGTFRSNRTAWTAVPGVAELHLPVFTEADPSIVTLIGMEIDLVPDGDGYVASIHGGVRVEDAKQAAADGLLQMIASDPGGHLLMPGIFDIAPRDGVISRDEILEHNLFLSLFAEELTLEGVPVIGLGFQVHLTPCDAGRCSVNQAFDSCFDRVLDGDETDTDCGGSCRGCETGATCTSADDCETVRCDGGRCGPPSCTNGVRDGLETGIDCGSGCGGCQVGEACVSNADCITAQCGAPPPPCPPDTLFGCSDWPSYDRCQ